jgi:hypothetical protein
VRACLAPLLTVTCRAPLSDTPPACSCAWVLQLADGAAASWQRCQQLGTAAASGVRLSRTTLSRRCRCVHMVCCAAGCREAQAELVERIQMAVALPVRTSIRDVYDDTCTELLVTAQLDSGAPPHVLHPCQGTQHICITHRVQGTHLQNLLDGHSTAANRPDTGPVAHLEHPLCQMLPKAVRCLAHSSGGKRSSE